MKKLLKNLSFGAWIYFDLIRLREYKRNIKTSIETGDQETERENILMSTKTWGDDIMKKLKIDLHITGVENIPEGPVVFVSNHQGYGDIAVYCAAITNKQFGFVAKDDLAKIPYFGKWIQRIRSVFIERDDARASLKAIEEGIALLENGYSLVVFPEGTRSKGPEMGEFKKGSLRLATKPGVPVVPITLSGTYHIFEEKGYAQSAKVEFYIHPAIETKNLSKPQANNLAATVEEIIRLKLDEFNSL